METRICKKCGVEKPLSEYEREIKKGKTYYRWECRNCRKDIRAEYCKRYRKKKPEKQREINYKLFEQNKEKIYINRKIKRESDEVYKCEEYLRTRIGKAFRKKGCVQSENLEKILGCTTKEFYTHLLKTYRSNYGENYDGRQEVNIDHIIPLATAKTVEDVYRLFHHSNLQLLTAEDNGKKWCKLDWKIEREN